MIDEEELRYYIRRTDELEEKLDKLVELARAVVQHRKPELTGIAREFQGEFDTDWYALRDFLKENNNE